MIILHHIPVVNGTTQTLLVDKGVIHFAGGNGLPLSSGPDALQLHLDNCIAFPGLINSHDHLDFDLFPKLGNRVYNDYTEWGTDIHAVNKHLIDPVLQVPRDLRVQWGVYKNLLNGVTTVVHHGHYVSAPDACIEVFQNCNMLHSVQLEKGWRLKLNKPWGNGWPWAIHIGEGTNAKAWQEINTLINWNIFKKKLIGIHGVAMDARQAKAFAGLVWCPDSNFFLLGATAAINQLKHSTSIVFGTDSTLSAGWNTWEQVRLARKTGLLTDQELFNALTISPAALWNKPQVGALQEGMQADIVIARQKGQAGSLDSFFAINPEDILLVLKQGKIVLFDESLLHQLHLSGQAMQGYSTIGVNNAGKYVAGDLPALVRAIHAHAPGLALPVKSVAQTA